MNLADLYLSGNVRRWHSNPSIAPVGQTVADHQGRAVLLLLLLHPKPSITLVRACALHDAGELFAGDLSATFKRKYPDVAKAHGELEQSLLNQALGFDLYEGLEPDEHRWLVLIDKLEAFCFMLVHAPREKDRDGWPDARKALMAKCWSIDPLVLSSQVAGLIHDLEART